jgi:hypothetical protein
LKAKFGGLEVTEATPVAIISAIEAEDTLSEWLLRNSLSSGYIKRSQLFPHAEWP